MITKLEETIQALFDDEIRLVEVDIEKCEIPNHAMSYYDPETKTKTIFINKDIYRTDNETRMILEHEREHLKNITNTMYNCNASTYEITQKENVVNKALWRRLISFEQLQDLVCKQRLGRWEIAEKLNVTEDIVQQAYDYYSTLDKWKNMTNSTDDTIHDY